MLIQFGNDHVYNPIVSDSGFRFFYIVSLIFAHLFCAKINVTRNLGKVRHVSVVQTGFLRKFPETAEFDAIKCFSEIYKSYKSWAVQFNSLLNNFF